MVKLKIKTDAIGCRKPGCKYRLLIPHRHHRKCESLFVHAFVSVDRKRKTKRYREFVKRYKAFREQDVILLCPWHHCEIHLAYEPIIFSHLNKPPEVFTWKQAWALMNELEEHCRDWEEEETDGVHPDMCGFDRRDD